MLPSQYKPTQVSDFVGQTRQVAELIEKQIRFCKANGNAPIKVMLLGQPGIGKSAMADWLTRHPLNVQSWATETFNGTDLNIDTVKDLADSFRRGSLLSGYRVIRIEEVDKMTPTAQVRFLTLLDQLPNDAAVICTSNCKPNHFDDRFQSRFTLHEITPPNPDDIGILIKRNWGKFLTDTAITNIVTFACGNVRQALLDTETAMLAAA